MHEGTCLYDAGSSDLDTQIEQPPGLQTVRSCHCFCSVMLVPITDCSPQHKGRVILDRTAKLDLSVVFRAMGPNRDEGVMFWDIVVGMNCR
jgi:hypothetical protein